MIMKHGFARGAVAGAVSGGLLGLLAGVAVLAVLAGTEDMAVKIGNFNFAPQRVTVKAGATVTRKSADDIAHADASIAKVSRLKALDTEYDTGFICGTQKEAERLAMLLDGNEDTAIAMVNAEERNPRACAVETVAFVRGASLAMERSRADTFAVVEVLVVGADRGSGFQSVAPGAYFMLVKIDERNA
jgi:plastocyanin